MSGSSSSGPDALHAPSAEAAAPLAMTVHAVPDPVLARERRLSGRIKMGLILAACAAPVLASYLSYYVIRPESRTNYGALIDPPRALPSSLTLGTLDGGASPAAALKGQWLLVSLASGACDAACEQRLYMQRQLREMLGREKDRLERVWFVIDTEPVRPALREAMPAAQGASVWRVAMADLAGWLQPASGQTLQDHLYLVDPMGQWMMRMPVNPDPARVKRDLDRLLRASASWDRAGR